jgi:hypothetical protein
MGVGLGNGCVIKKTLAIRYPNFLALLFSKHFYDMARLIWIKKKNTLRNLRLVEKIHRLLL